VLLAAFVARWSVSSATPRTRQEKSVELQITARSRLFPEIAAGISEMKRDAAGHTYVLAAPPTFISIYAAGGKRAGQIPQSAAPGSRIVFAQDFDLDDHGRILVADRGGNSVKIFASDGSFAGAIPVQAPNSIVALPGGGFAVTTLTSKRLISVFDAEGKPIASFGDPVAPSGVPPDLILLYNRGRITGDPTGHIYFAFTYCPTPTIRQYDRSGYLGYQISLAPAEFGLATLDQRKDIFGIERASSDVSLHTVINALGVDPSTQEVWASIADALVHFDPSGNRLAAYRTLTMDGARLEPSVILVEPDCLLLAADPAGIFLFARPDKSRPQAPAR
jgi:hypothetical protein